MPPTNDTENINYLEKLTDPSARHLLLNFFEKSVIKDIPSKELLHLVDCINKDFKNNVIEKDTRRKKSTLTNKQLNSKTHKTFLSITKKYFGNDAYKLLKERKNLSIFNLKEVHVLHQEIFDNLGKKFVNAVLNYELTGATVTIPKLLNDKEEMKNFKFFYQIYTENIGTNPEHYDNLFVKYDRFKFLIKEMRQNKLKLSSEQKNILKEILRDENNPYNINNLKEFNDYYKLKNDKYTIDKQRAILYKDETFLKSSMLANFFALKRDEYSKTYSFYADSNYISNILKHYDIDDIINKKQNIEGVTFTDEELDILKDLKEIDEADFEQTLKIAEKYEKKGNRISNTVLNLIDKIPLTFTKNMIDSISKVDQLEEKCKNNEEGIIKGEIKGFPTYTLNGTDFAFLQTTNFIGAKGLSSNEIKGDLAESWFTYENGTSHISCSYINQDKLCSIEFTNDYESFGEKLTYLFDEADIKAMGSDDIFTPATSRVANINSSQKATKFMYADKLIQNSGISENNEFDYNEIAINRYNLNTNTIRFGGKIIPSAILVNSEISQRHIDAARSFTKFLIKNGLKEEGYKMPIVVVNKQAYQAKKLRNFAESLKSPEQEEKAENISQQNENIKVEQKTQNVSKGVMK